MIAAATHPQNADIGERRGKARSPRAMRRSSDGSAAANRRRLDQGGSAVWRSSEADPWIEPGEDQIDSMLSTTNTIA